MCQRLRSMFVTTAILAAILMLASCSDNPTESKDSDTALIWQAVVDSLNALHPQNVPSVNPDNPDVATDSTWFDAEEYFNVLTHVSMDSGYILDYVYFNNGLGAQPFLYARATDEEPFQYYRDFEASMPEANWNERAHAYLNHVCPDDNADGYFEYALLRLLGGQFYLFWHADYFDTRVICSRTCLQDVLNTGNFGDPLPTGFRNQASSLDITPRVTLSDTTAVVSIATFSKWGGINRREITIRRECPAGITNETATCLLYWNCGLAW